MAAAPAPGRRDWRVWAGAALALACLGLQLETSFGGGKLPALAAFGVSGLAALDLVLLLAGAAFLGWMLSRLPAADARRAAPLFLLGAAVWAGWPWDGARAAAGGVAAFLAVESLLAGDTLLGWLLPESRAEEGAPGRLLLAYGLGAGALALAGLVTAAGVPFFYLAPLLLWRRRGLAAARAAVRGIADGLEKAGGAGWALAAAVTAVLLLLARGCWLPELDYDVMEYHAAVPLQYLQGGLRQPHNMFAAFPQLTEMLTYCTFALNTLGRDGADVGARAPEFFYAARLLDFLFLPMLLGALVLTLARADAGRPAALRAGLLAVLTLLAMPGVIQWSLTLYVENAFGFYFLLALYAAARAVFPADNPGGGRWVLLAGVLAGLCAGTKYPGLLFAGAGACGLLLLFSRGRGNRLGRAALCGGACWLVFSPWLVKNYLLTGNPFAPLWNLGFGVENWDAVQTARFDLAHRPGWGEAPGAGLFTPGALLRQAGRLFLGFGNLSFGALALAGLGGFCLREKTPAPAARAGNYPLFWGVLLAFVFAVWFLLTHRIERFFYAGLLLTALIGGWGWRRLLPAAGWTGVAAAAVAGVMAAAFAGGVYGAEPGGVRVGAVLGGEVSPAEYLAANHRYERLRRTELRGRKCLLAGPADVLYLDARALVYATVFDRHPFLEAVARAGDARELAGLLRARGVGAVYFHWGEWLRLQSTYHRAYALSPDKQRLVGEFLRTELVDGWVTPSADPAWPARFAAANPGIFPAPGGALRETFGFLR